MINKDINIALVGTGAIASIHAEAIASLPAARLAAVTSVPETQSRAFAESHGCDFEPNLEALVRRSDIDMVAITTPSGTHAETGIAAARRGKHVLTEKPIDITLEKVDALIQACDEAGVLLGGVLQSRTGDSGRVLKDAIEKNRFGKLSQCSAYVPWYRTPEYYSSVGWRGTWDLDGGGALMNQGIHAIDLLIWLAGDVEEVSAFCQTRIHNIEVEDNAVAWLRFANGAIGVIQATTCSFPGQPKRIEIMGPKGTAILEDDIFKVWEFADKQPGDSSQTVAASDSGIGGGFSDPKEISSEGHRRIYADFIEAIRSDRPSEITGREARRAVELINAIYRSSREGRRIKLR